MKINNTIKKHIGLFFAALFISATAFAFDTSMISNSAEAQMDLQVDAEYFSKELLAWL